MPTTLICHANYLSGWKIFGHIHAGLLCMDTIIPEIMETRPDYLRGLKGDHIPHA